MMPVSVGVMRPRDTWYPLPPVAPLTVGVGLSARDPVQPAALVWRIDGASRDIDRPCGVVFVRQIIADSVEPMRASRCRNLLSHKDRGPAGTDEAIKVRPQMPWITCSGSFPCEAFALAGTGAGPDGSIVRPASKSGCDGPEPGTSEEMALREASEVICSHVLYGAGVNLTGRDHAVRNQLTQGGYSFGVVFVVVGGHFFNPEVGGDAKYARHARLQR